MRKFHQCDGMTAASDILINGFDYFVNVEYDFGRIFVLYIGHYKDFTYIDLKLLKSYIYGSPIGIYRSI